MTDRIEPHFPPAEYGQVELLVIGGSQAYGLATPESDHDYKGFFSAPVETVLGLRSAYDSWVSHEPADIAMHETKHFLKLALACNPNIIEVLAITEPELILQETELARDLRAHLSCFFSTRAVQNAYGGYAMSQFTRLKNRQGTFSSDTAKRTAKHARHLLRLLLQGAEILRTGQLTVRVDETTRAALFEFGELPYEQMVEEAERYIAQFNEVPSSLPDSPDFAMINAILTDYRFEQIAPMITRFA
jgi:predicted nucleotidyltransferase